MTSKMMTPSNPALLPCPFCGSSEIDFQRNEGYSVVFCKKCGCQARHPNVKFEDSLPMAFKRWNTRTPAVASEFSGVPDVSGPSVSVDGDATRENASSGASLSPLAVASVELEKYKALNETLYKEISYIAQRAKDLRSKTGFDEIWDIVVMCTRALNENYAALQSHRTQPAITDEQVKAAKMAYFNQLNHGPPEADINVAFRKALEAAIGGTS